MWSCECNYREPWGRYSKCSNCGFLFTSSGRFWKKAATVTELSSRDRDIFQALLDADEEPNAALTRAFRGTS